MDTSTNYASTRPSENLSPESGKFSEDLPKSKNPRDPLISLTRLDHQDLEVGPNRSSIQRQQEYKQEYEPQGIR